MSTQDNDGNVSSTGANKVDNQASSIAKNIVGLEQSTQAKTSQPKPAVQKILAPAKPHISIVNGETTKEDPKAASSSKKKGFSIPFFGNKNSNKVKLGSGSKINKKFALIPVALIAVFGSYLIVSSFATGPVMQGNDGLFTPLDPARILDTRNGEGDTTKVTGSTKTSIEWKEIVEANQTLDVQVTGKGGVPASGVSSVMITVTALNPTTNGESFVWAADTGRPETSNINFTKDESTSNTIISKISPQGKIRLYHPSGEANYIIDVVGYYSAADDPEVMHLHYNPVNPSRIFDTRGQNENNPINPGDTIEVDVVNRGGILSPYKINAATLNITVASPLKSGELSIWPSGKDETKFGIFSFNSNKNVAHTTTVKVGENDKIKITNHSQDKINIAIDALGYYTDINQLESNTELSESNLELGNRYTAVDPKRPPARSDPPRTQEQQGEYYIAANSKKDITLTNQGIPADILAQAVNVNLTIIESTAKGHLVSWGTDNPPVNTTSIINFPGDQKISNNTTLKLNKNGTLTIQNNSDAEVKIKLDVLGYFARQKSTNNKVLNVEYGNKDKITELLENAVIDNNPYTKLIFPNNGKPSQVWDIKPIVIKQSNLIIELEKGVEVTSNNTLGSRQSLITINDKKNITIIGYGAKLSLPRDKYSYCQDKNNDNPPGCISNEYRSIINTVSSDNIKIIGVEIEGAVGDGITLGATYECWKKAEAIRKSDACMPNKYIYINDVSITNSARNGISVMSVDGLKIANTKISNSNGRSANITNTRDLNVGPWAGIDFEPNAANEYFKNVIVSNTNIYDNSARAVLFALIKSDSNTQPADIKFYEFKAGLSQEYYNSRNQTEKTKINKNGLINYVDQSNSEAKNEGRTKRPRGLIIFENSNFDAPKVNSTDKLPGFVQLNRPEVSPAIPSSPDIIINKIEQAHTTQDINIGGTE